MGESVFYMVYLQGGNNPRFVHGTEALAQAEATRLTKENGRTSYVLKSITKVELHDVKITPMGIPDDMFKGEEAHIP